MPATEPTDPDYDTLTFTERDAVDALAAERDEKTREALTGYPARPGVKR